MGLYLTFTNRNSGWAHCVQFVGGPQEIASVLGTRNGGKTWAVLATNLQTSKVSPIPQVGLGNAMRFRGARTGWMATTDFGCMGGPGHTVDGGRRWAIQRVLPPSFTSSTAAQSHLCSFSLPTFFGYQGVMTAVTHAGNLLLRSTNGGATWRIVAHLPKARGAQEAVNGTTSWAHRATFTSAATAWTHIGSTAYTTANGGATWVAHRMSGWSSKMAGGVDFLNRTDAWAAIQTRTMRSTAPPVVWRSTDGGIDWTRPSSAVG